MTRVRKLKPMSIKRINMMMEDYNSDYHLEKLETGEIVMVRNDAPSKKQVQPNLLAHLKEDKEE